VIKVDCGLLAEKTPKAPVPADPDEIISDGITIDHAKKMRVAQVRLLFRPSCTPDDSIEAFTMFFTEFHREE
jgi:hypothetical protein